MAPQSQSFLILAGTVLSVIVLGMTSMLTGSPRIAQVIEGVQGIRIAPRGEAGVLTVRPGDTVDLTAMGQLATSAIPIKALWTPSGAMPKDTRFSCNNVERCSFQVGRLTGRFGVAATLEDGTQDRVTIVIEEDVRNPFTDEPSP